MGGYTEDMEFGGLGFPKIRGYLFGGLYWGPLILGNYHIPGDRCLT